MFSLCFEKLDKVHKPSFWAFIFNFNRLLHHYYLKYLRFLEHGSDNFVRGRKKVTKNNLVLRRKAEQKLSEGVYTWREFLGAVSHTSDTLSDRLQQEFHENRDLVLQDLEINTEANDQIICSNCNLNILEKFMIGPCGDYNVCGQCIETVRQSNEPNCPTCGHRIENVIRFRQL